MRAISRSSKFYISLLLILFTITSFSIKGTILFLIVLGLYFVRYPSVMFSNIRYGHLSVLLIFGLLPVYSTIVGTIYSYEHLLKFYFLAVATYLLLNVINYYRRSADDTDDIVKWYTYVIALFALLQLLVYMSVGTYLDYYGFLRERYGYSAYQIKELYGALIPIRITGMYSEPSFLAMALLPALGYFLYVDRIKNWSFAIAILVVALSMSSAALVVMVLMLFVYVLLRAHNVKVFLVMSGFCCALAMASGPLVYERIVEPKTYDAFESRLHIFRELSVRNFDVAMFGTGIFLDEFGNDNGVTRLSAAEVRDTGFIFHILYSFGYIGLGIACLLAIAYMFISGGKVLLFLPLLLLKFGFLLSTFYILLIFLAISLKDENRE